MPLKQYEWGGAEFDTEAEWQEWVNDHPRRAHLRMTIQDGITYIYDREAFEAAIPLDRAAHKHKVAWIQVRDGRQRFMVMPDTAKVAGG